MPEATGDRQEQRGSFWQSALQSVAIFLLIQFVIRSFTGGSQNANTNSSTGGSTPANKVSIPAFSDRPGVHDLATTRNPVPQMVAPIFPLNSSVDLTVYVSTSSMAQSLKSIDPKYIVLQEKQFKIGNWDDARDIQTTFPVPSDVRNNGTLWAHFYVAQSGNPLDPFGRGYDEGKAWSIARPLNQYLKKRKVSKVRNLLSSSSDDEKQEADGDEVEESRPTYASYYHPNFTLSFIPDTGTLSLPQMHPAMFEWVKLDTTNSRDITGQHGWYYPILFLNRFWQLRNHMTEINNTVTELPLNIKLTNLANWKFSITTSMEFGMKQQAAGNPTEGMTFGGGGDGSEFEEVKRILLDSNIYLLSTTMIVGVLHTIFEFLAFKNDVSHWRKKKDNVGVSVRTILANVFMQTIIFLYLLDNNENTSWMILLGQGMGILVEAWKITKTVNVRIRQTPTDCTSIPWKFLPYMIVFEDKHKLSESEEKTKEYDEIAFSYMYWVGVPLILAYAAYSLYYESHKSWYSFIITTLVGSVYAYGFLLMVPSLYINYRLKSVAHMPGKAMTYKVLSTFIDDLFAFTIKMPLLHRLATLRDDVIFFVYVYQKWKYKTDYTRVNEFGQGGEDEPTEETKEETKKLAVEISKTESTDEAVVKASGRDQGTAKKRG